MRVVIASTFVPFVKGGGTKIADDLEAELSRRGVETAKVMLPLFPAWEAIPEQTLALRLLDLADISDDRLICIRFPSHALRHPNKVAWFIHHYREAYDLWDSPWCPIPHNDRGERYRQQLIASDNLFLGECRSIYTNSKIVGERLRIYNRIDADGVLYPPLPSDHPFRPGEFGDYLFYPSRVNEMKRQKLAIEALVHTHPSLKLVIAGTSETPAYLDSLKARVEELGLKDRVHFTGWITEEEKAKWMAGCCACLYLAFEEDSYGYVTLEAYHAEKPVIALTDSGGALEIVEDGLNGLVAEPTPDALAVAMTRCWWDREEAQRMGREGRRTIDRLNIGWDRVVERLTA